MPISLDDAVLQLKSYKQIHFDMGESLLKADGGSLFPVDFLTIGVLNRSLSLLIGFTKMIEDHNFICAGPLVRLQIDNCLRFSAGTLVDKPHDFSMSVLNGVPIRKMKDRSGKFMTDSYLVEQLSKEYPWVSNVYNETCEFIHLSYKHMFIPTRAAKEDNILEIFIGEKNSFVPKESLTEASEAFMAATDILMNYVQGWIFTKENPEIAAQMRANANNQSAIVT